MWRALLILCGCTEPTGPRPVIDGEGFFDRPWPSDDRTVDGHPDMAGFPGDGQYELLTRYMDVAEKQVGFGTNSPIYLRFEHPLDTDLLPTPDQSRSLDSCLMLMDVDPNSPQRGQLVPVEWDFQEAATHFQPENFLAVRPVWGFPLRPATTYALVVTTDLARPAPNVADYWRRGSEQWERTSLLYATLVQLGIPTSKVAVATVFTTTDPVGEMARLADAVYSSVGLQDLSQDVVLADDYSSYKAYEGTILLPMWMHGQKPYATEGGAFQWDEDGRPLLYGWDRATFTLSVPANVDQPEGGWPVVMYAHGTFGYHGNFADDRSRLEPARVLASAGLAGFGISQPLHHERGDFLNETQLSLYSFNYLNPDSALSMFRQSALDSVYLARLLSSQGWTFTTEDGEEILTDPDKLAFMGHSQGGITGAIAAPFHRGNVRAALFSGAGGVIAIAMIERDLADIGIDELLAQQFELDPGEELDGTHPLTGVVQMLAEVTDPINYAPYWHRVEPPWPGQPLSVLMTGGQLDIDTPPPTTDALAGAGGNPILDPVVNLSPVAELRGLYGVVAPLRGNVTAWDGSSVSAALAQYPDDDHFAIFDNQDAADMYIGFLSSAIEEEPPPLIPAPHGD